MSSCKSHLNCILSAQPAMLVQHEQLNSRAIQCRASRIDAEEDADVLLSHVGSACNISLSHAGSAWADTDVASRPAAVPAVSMLGPLNWGRTLRRKALISTANM